MDALHDIFDIQLAQNQNMLAVALSISCHESLSTIPESIRKPLVSDIPVVCWHELIYDGVFTWPLFQVISENKGQVHVREFLLQKDLFFFLQMSASIIMHCAANKGFKDGICMIEVVICIIV